MRIFKFGGASVKDANGVKNLITILNTLGSEKTLIVVSAMGKTTNSLELVVKNYFDNKEELQHSLNEVFTFHNNILEDLFNDNKYEIFSDAFEFLVISQFRFASLYFESVLINVLASNQLHLMLE